MKYYLVNYNLTGIERLTKSQVNGCIRKALHAVGVRWRRLYLAKHFTKGGAREYGYKPRQGESNPKKPGTYSYYKLKQFKHVLPLVYTGELKKLALYGERRVIAKATSSAAYVRVVFPRKANFVIADLRKVSQRELVDLQKFLVDQLEREFKRIGAAGVRASVGFTAGDSTPTAAA